MTKLLMLDSVDSTMDEAERQAASGQRGPLVVCARAQTGGVGRHGRRWASPPGNLYWTMLLDAAADRPREAGLAFAAGLAAIDAVAGLGLARSRLRLKWPNDVLLDGRKLAGVLVRSSVTGAEAHTVVGIGVNVADAPAGTAYPATSLVQAGAAAPAIEALRDAMTRAFLARRAAWHRDGLAALRDEAAGCLHGVDAPVSVALDRDRTRVLSGINLGLDAAGALRLQLADGTVRAVMAGDVLA